MKTKNKQTNHFFHAIPFDFWEESKKLTNFEFRVLLQFYRFTDFKTKKTFVTKKKIANELSVSVSALQSPIKTLTENGFILSIKQKGKTVRTINLTPSKEGSI